MDPNENSPNEEGYQDEMGGDDPYIPDKTNEWFDPTQMGDAVGQDAWTYFGGSSSSFPKADDDDLDVDVEPDKTPPPEDGDLPDFVESDPSDEPAETEELVEEAPAYFSANLFPKEIDLTVFRGTSVAQPDRDERLYLSYAYNGILGANFFDEGYADGFPDGRWSGEDYILALDDGTWMKFYPQSDGSYSFQVDPPELAAGYMTILEIRDYDFVLEQSTLTAFPYGDLDQPQIMAGHSVAYSEEELMGMRQALGLMEGQTTDSLLFDVLLSRAKDLTMTGIIRKDAFVRTKHPRSAGQYNFNTLNSTSHRLFIDKEDDYVPIDRGVPIVEAY